MRPMNLNINQKSGENACLWADGHTTMLLGAAKYLAEKGNFNGTINFIFQPAEENEGGGRAMIEEGLFEKYPVESVYGMHNWPGMPVGTFAIKLGPLMAAFDVFNVKIIGKGGHAAMPQTTVDPIIIGTKVIDAYQSIVSRYVDPQEPVVLSVTQFHGGDAYNVIPNEVEIKGCARCFSPKVQNQLEIKWKKSLNQFVMPMEQTMFSSLNIDTLPRSIQKMKLN